MPKGAAVSTYHRYLDIVKIIREWPDVYNQASLAKHMNVSPTTISKFLNGYPWHISFQKDKIGRISYTGIDVDIPDEIRFAERKQPEKFESDPAVLTAVFSSGDPFLGLRQAARNHLNKMQHRPHDANMLLSGANQVKVVERLRKFAAQVNYEVDQMVSLPQFGRDEWWMDYLGE